VRRCPSYGAKRRDADLLLMLLLWHFAFFSTALYLASLCVSSAPLFKLCAKQRARGTRACVYARARRRVIERESESFPLQNSEEEGKGSE